MSYSQHAYMVVFQYTLTVIPVCPVIIYLDKKEADAQAEILNSSKHHSMAPVGVVSVEAKIPNDFGWKAIA